MRYIFLILLFIVFILVGCASSVDEVQTTEFHIHADFKVYIDDKQIDFSVLMYQLRDRFVHVEHGIGDTVHIHKRGVTIGDFFETLGITFNRTCIIIQIEGSYCNTAGKNVSFYVNGIENSEFEDYEIKDLDKILVSYGKGDKEEQLASITSFASEE